MRNLSNYIHNYAHSFFGTKRVPKRVAGTLVYAYTDMYQWRNRRYEKNNFHFPISSFQLQLLYILCLRVSEANEVPISSHIWVGLSILYWL